jgi:predicted aspartyl protease
MIPWELAEALGYKPELSKEKVTLITASGVETAPLIEIKKIRFLGEELDNVSVVCHDLPPKSYVTGLLGSSFLRHFKITIDYPKGVFEISKQ